MTPLPRHLEHDSRLRANRGLNEDLVVVDEGTDGCLVFATKSRMYVYGLSGYLDSQFIVASAGFSGTFEYVQLQGSLFLSRQKMSSAKNSSPSTCSIEFQTGSGADSLLPLSSATEGEKRVEHILAMFWGIFVWDQKIIFNTGFIVVSKAGYIVSS